MNSLLFYKLIFRLIKKAGWAVTFLDELPDLAAKTVNTLLFQSLKRKEKPSQKTNHLTNLQQNHFKTIVYRI